MQDATLVKKWQNALLRKENDIVRDAMLYCSNNNIEFTKKHNILMRNAMRLFFKNGVYPIIRDLYEDNVKDYPCAEPKK